MKRIILVISCLFFANFAFSTVKVNDNLEVGLTSWADLTAYQLNKTDNDKSKKFGWDLGRTNIPVNGKIDDNMSVNLNVRYENAGEVYTTEKLFANILTFNYANLFLNGLKVTIGKMQIPFAQMYAPLAIDSYLYTNSNTPYTITQDPSNINNYFSNANYIGLKTSKLGLTLAYEKEKIFKAAATVYESDKKSATSGTSTTYVMMGDQDNGMWQSYSLKLNIYLLTGLDASLAYINDRDGNKPRRNQSATSVAFKYNNSFMEAFGEFVNGKTHYNVKENYLQAGLGYKFLEKYSFYALWENMILDSFGSKTKLNKYAIGPKITLAKNTELMATYINEQGRGAQGTKAQAYKLRLAFQF